MTLKSGFFTHFHGVFTVFSRTFHTFGSAPVFCELKCENRFVPHTFAAFELDTNTSSIIQWKTRSPLGKKAQSTLISIFYVHLQRLYRDQSSLGISKNEHLEPQSGPSHEVHHCGSVL